MTLTISVQHPTFVLLSSERLQHRVDSLTTETVIGPPASYSRKVVIHESLPLAFATAGLGELGGRSTTTLLAEFAETLSSPSELVGVEVGKRLVTHFGPLVQGELARAGVPSGSPLKLDVHVGLYGATPELYFVHITVDSATSTKTTGQVGCPTTVKRFFQSTKYRNDIEIFGKPQIGANRLAEQLRKLFAEAIAFEKKASGGSNREIGGAVDIALVDKSGARFLPHSGRRR